MTSLPIQIVIPCYNEALRLPVDRMREFVQAHRDVGLLFVNDGSTDATQSVLDDLCAAYPDRIACLSLDRNQGKAEAVRCGMLHAMKGSPEFVGYLDADLSTPIEEILRLRACFESTQWVEIVLGSRVKLLGRRIHRGAMRHFLGRVFATVASRVLSWPVYDTQCGAKLMRPTPAIREALAQPFFTRWVFDIELLARFSLAKGDPPDIETYVVECPLMTWQEVGDSKLSRAAMWRAAADLWRVYIWLRKSRRRGASQA